MKKNEGARIFGLLHACICVCRAPYWLSAAKSCAAISRPSASH